MIDLRKCPHDSVVYIDNIECDEDIRFFLSGIDGDFEARVHLDHEDVAKHMGFRKREIRVPYEDHGEDYIIEFIRDGETFTHEDFLDNMIEVAVEQLKFRAFDKFGTHIIHHEKSEK